MSLWRCCQMPFQNLHKSRALPHQGECRLGHSWPLWFLLQGLYNGALNARCPSCLTCSWDEGPLTYGFPTGRPGFFRHSTSSHPQSPASDSLLVLLLNSTATQAALSTGHLFLASRPKSLLAVNGSLRGMISDLTPLKKKNKTVVWFQSGRTLFAATKVWLEWLPNTKALALLFPCQAKGPQLHVCSISISSSETVLLNHLFAIWRSRSSIPLFLRVNWTGPSLLSPNSNNPKTQFIINKLKTFLFLYCPKWQWWCQSTYEEK